jgi:hypothetical protein
MTDEQREDAGIKPAEIKPADSEPAELQPTDSEAETDQRDQLLGTDYVTGSMARGIDETYKELERLPD